MPAPTDPAETEPSTLLTVPEAAARLPISTRTLWGLIHAGKAPHRRIGSRVFLKYPDDIDQLIEDALVPARDAA